MEIIVGEGRTMPDDTERPTNNGALRYIGVDVAATMPDGTRVVMLDTESSVLPDYYLPIQVAAYRAALETINPTVPNPLLSPEDIMEKAKTDPTRTFGQVWSDSILVSAIAYLQTGEMVTGDFGTQRFFGEVADPVAILNKAFMDAGLGYGEDITMSALTYVRCGERATVVDTNAAAFFAQPDGPELQTGMLGRPDGTLAPAEVVLPTDEVEEEPVMLTCCTEQHEYEEGTDPDCSCTTASGCGCSYNPDDSGECSHCDQCNDCCNNDGECYTCQGCDRRKPTDEQCSNCEECERCCNNNGDCVYCDGCGRTVSGDDYCSTCSRCTTDSCCECWHCNGCSETYRSTDRGGETYQCGDCDCCDDCCVCVTCGRCGEHCTSYCANCERCSDCCRGDDDCDPQPVGRPTRRSGSTPRSTNGGQPIPYREENLRFHHSGRLEFKRNPLRRHISVEIEVDGAIGTYPTHAAPLLLAAVEKWGDSVVSDGSLNSAVAHEVNTQPTNGDKFLQHIEELTKGYAEIGASCSDCCGLHVHVNAKDLTFYDMRKVLAVYARTERALFELTARRRLHGTYSQICGYNYVNMSSDPRTFKRQLLGTLYNAGGQIIPRKPQPDMKETIEAAKNEKDGVRQHALRYRALNIHSYFHRGSIEFRHHEGTVDFAEITNWAMVCGNLIEAAAKMSEAKIMQLSDEPHEALLAILPASLHEYCNAKWETAVIPASIFKQEHRQYGGASRDRNDEVWRDFSKQRGTLPMDGQPVPNEKKKCGYCGYINGARTYCASCDSRL